MMNCYLAHSAKAGFCAQPYRNHVQGVYERATQYAENAAQYTHTCGLTSVVQQAALLHDLGKLEDKNQIALQDATFPKHHLPINHVDAGSAALMKRNLLYAALIVYSHHKGLPDVASELLKDENSIFRDENISIREHTNAELSKLIERHSSLCPIPIPENNFSYDGDQSIFFRMALSCLADADHTDTSAVYGQLPLMEKLPSLRAKERLQALDCYVSNLGGNDERNQLRKEMYYTCRNADVTSSFSICNSPVGSGKTTALMAHLLQQAIQRNARHIFVVLPYTNIIHQAVDVYRKALVLPGENPDDIIAELHSRTDFQDINTRYLTSQWQAPIIVTTAVSFFETMASNQPSALRRLHELPGSVIFLDEAHNALPIKLLPLAWRWMNILSEDWSCYWTLASGSLVRYWELSSLRDYMPQPSIDELVCFDLQDRLLRYETKRIRFPWKKESLSRKELIDWVQSTPGPRLLILNTVQSAAVIASDICAQHGRTRVEHLSTALTPKDRNTTLERIKQRLSNPNDTDWTLVSTSCVETGVDLSFRTGFREMSSLLSLLQAAGRVNRHGRYHNSEMWSFSLQDDSMLKPNPQFDTSRLVLRNYFSNGFEITPELSTTAMNDELIQDDSCLKTIENFLEQEKNMQFSAIDHLFNVIESDTVPVIVDVSLAEKIAHGYGDWQSLQKEAISIRRYRKNSWKLKEIAAGIYQWTLGYDSFLGYMRGVLDLHQATNDTLII